MNKENSVKTHFTCMIMELVYGLAQEQVNTL